MPEYITDPLTVQDVATFDRMESALAQALGWPELEVAPDWEALLVCVAAMRAGQESLRVAAVQEGQDTAARLIVGLLDDHESVNLSAASPRLMAALDRIYEPIGARIAAEIERDQASAARNRVAGIREGQDWAAAAMRAVEDGTPWDEAGATPALRARLRAMPVTPPPEWQHPAILERDAALQDLAETQARAIASETELLAHIDMLGREQAVLVPRLQRAEAALGEPEGRWTAADLTRRAGGWLAQQRDMIERAEPGPDASRRIAEEGWRSAVETFAELLLDSSILRFAVAQELAARLRAPSLTIVLNDAALQRSGASALASALLPTPSR